MRYAKKRGFKKSFKSRNRRGKKGRGRRIGSYTMSRGGIRL